MAGTNKGRAIFEFTDTEPLSHGIRGLSHGIRASEILLPKGQFEVKVGRCFKYEWEVGPGRQNLRVSFQESTTYKAKGVASAYSSPTPKKANKPTKKPAKQVGHQNKSQNIVAKVRQDKNEVTAGRALKANNKVPVASKGKPQGRV